MERELLTRVILMLRDLEEDSEGRCPKCHLYGGAHERSCELAALIRDLEAEGAA